MNNFLSEQSFFMKLLEVVKNQEEEYLGLADFLFYFDNASAEELYVNAARKNSLSVLTIHKSKGLEFPVVVIPFLKMIIRPATGVQDINSYVQKLPSNSLTLLHITATNRKYSLKLNDIYRKAYIQSCIDELNNIYVSTTRAKFELYIFIPKVSVNNKNKAWFLIPTDVKERGERKIYKPETDKEISPIHYLPPADYVDWVNFLKEEFGPARSLINRDKIIIGTVMHEVFYHLGNLKNQDIKVMLDRAIGYAKKKYSGFANFNLLKDKICNLLKGSEFYPFFNVAAEIGRASCRERV